MEKIDIIVRIIMIIAGIPLLLFKITSNVTELIFCIWLIRIGILYLMITSIIGIYKS